MKLDTKRRKKQLSLARRRQWLAAFGVTLVCFSLGTVLAWTYGPEVIQGLTQREVDLLIYAPSIGGMIGACLGGAAVEVAGRKKSIIVFTIPIILGWIFVGVEYNFIMTFTGRFLTGLGGGAGLVGSIVFVSELAEECRRGVLLCLIQLMILSGYLFLDIFGNIFETKSLAYICGLFPTLALSIVTNIPESARFLVKRRRLAQAAKSVAWFRGSDIPEVAAERVQAKSQSIQRARLLSNSWRGVFSRPVLKPFLIVAVLILMYEMSGFSTVLTYRQLLLYKPGISLSQNSLLILIGAILLLVTAVAALVIDWAGRRVLLILSGALTTSALVTLGTYYYITHAEIVLPGTKPSHLWIPLGSCLVYLFGFSLGIGPIPWVLMGELLPPNSKGYCLIPIIFYWFFHILLVNTERDLTKDVGLYWKFWFPSIFCLFGTLFLLCVLPETRKKRIEKIEEYFGIRSLYARKSIIPTEEEMGIIRVVSESAATKKTTGTATQSTR